MDEILEQAVSKAFKDVAKEMYMDEDKDGLYCYELYVDYNDWLGEKEIAEIIDNANPMDAFYETLFSAYEQSTFYIENEILNKVEKLIKMYVPENSLYRRGLLPDERDEVRQYIQDHMYYEYPEDHYLKQEVNVDIKVDTGDMNYDYVLNCIQPAYNGCEIDKIDDNASIVWLTKQQGYTKGDLQNILRADEVLNPKGFLESVQQEIANETTYGNALFVLVKMTLKDLIELNELIKKQEPYGKVFYDANERPDCGTIVISKDVMLGLAETWCGGGSLLDIQLEKDLELPIRFIQYAMPDDVVRQYSIGSIY